MIWIFSADGRGGRAEIEGSIRGPRGPKNFVSGHLQKNGISSKKFPYWGRGVFPRGNFSHIIPFFSEDVPNLNVHQKDNM